MAKPVVLLLAALTLLLMGATAVTASTDDGEPGQDLDAARSLADAFADGQGLQDATQDEDIQEMISKLISAIRKQKQKKLEAWKQMILERRGSRQRREEAEEFTSTSTPGPQEVAPSTDAATDASAARATRPVRYWRPRKEKESSEEESSESERKGRRGKGRSDKKDTLGGKWSGSIMDVIFGRRGEVRPPAPDADGERPGGRRGHGRKNDDKWAFIADLMARRKTMAAARATDAKTPATGVDGEDQDA